MPDSSPAFGEALRREREARGWSLRELARHAGVSFGRLAELERGRDAHTDRPVAPGYRATVKIAAALGQDPADWLARAGHAPGPELTAEEWRVLGKIRRLPEDERRQLLAQWEAALDAWIERRVSQAGSVLDVSEPS
ncbi:MAG: helix-turn-helix transcriptional regulator [Candidatus Sericytochromatia bacterium]|nr:helix-turn-helix transcriptional regulator [Candidatus Sericytochromatia bacterium]